MIAKPKRRVIDIPTMEKQNFNQDQDPLIK